MANDPLTQIRTPFHMSLIICWNPSTERDWLLIRTYIHINIQLSTVTGTINCMSQKKSSEDEYAQYGYDCRNLNNEHTENQKNQKDKIVENATTVVEKACTRILRFRLLTSTPPGSSVLCHKSRSALPGWWQSWARQQSVGFSRRVPCTTHTIDHNTLEESHTSCIQWKTQMDSWAVLHGNKAQRIRHLRHFLMCQTAYQWCLHLCKSCSIFGNRKKTTHVFVRSIPLMKDLEQHC